MDGYLAGILILIGLWRLARALEKIAEALKGNNRVQP